MSTPFFGRDDRDRNHNTSDLIWFSRIRSDRNVPRVRPGVRDTQALRRAIFQPGRMRLSRGDVSFGLGTIINVQLNALVFSKSELLFFGSAARLGRGEFAASQSIAARVTVVTDALIGNLSYRMTSALGKGDEVLRRNALLRK